MRKVFFFALAFSVFSATSFAQADSLMDALTGEGPAKKKEPVIATFKATRIINSSTVENLGMGVLDLRISHRFGRLDQGFDNFLGFDNATTRIGLDYGITKWLMIGLGHSSLYKENDGFLKAKILGQQKKGMPITLSYFGAISVQGTKAPKLPDSTDKWLFTNRLYFTNQLLIARKFSERISLQLMPTLVHFNIVDTSVHSNNTFAIGIGGRIKVSRRVAITGEYYYRLTNADLTVDNPGRMGNPTYNSLSIGVDIETGGHVFQMFFSNSPGITERTFIGQTTDTWEKTAIHFGFNISRVFTVVKPKEFRKSEAKDW
jgi:opacity protein-like surface antigen